MKKHKITNNKLLTVKTKRKAIKSLNLYANIDWDKANKLFRQPILSSEKHLFPRAKELLHILAAVGTIGIVFAFPGAAPALGLLILGKNSYSRWRTKKVITQLKRQKFIAIKENKDNTVTVKITKNGMIRALTYKLDSMNLNKPKRWDRKWRAVIFDIPDKYKKVRDIFRMRLRQLSLYPLQESIYVSPYPCFNEIEFLRELYGIPFTVKYLLVEKIEDDRELRQHFELT